MAVIKPPKLKKVVTPVVNEEKAVEQEKVVETPVEETTEAQVTEEAAHQEEVVETQPTETEATEETVEEDKEVTEQEVVETQVTEATPQEEVVEDEEEAVVKIKLQNSKEKSAILKDLDEREVDIEDSNLYNTLNASGEKIHIEEVKRIFNELLKKDQIVGATDLEKMALQGLNRKQTDRIFYLLEEIMNVVVHRNPITFMGGMFTHKQIKDRVSNEVKTLGLNRNPAWKDLADDEIGATLVKAHTKVSWSDTIGKVKVLGKRKVDPATGKPISDWLPLD